MKTVYAVVDVMGYSPEDYGNFYGVFTTREKAEEAQKRTLCAGIVECELDHLLKDDGPHESLFEITIQTWRYGGYCATERRWWKTQSIGVTSNDPGQYLKSYARTYAEACEQLIQHLQRLRANGCEDFPDVRDISELPEENISKCFKK